MRVMRRVAPGLIFFLVACGSTSAPSTTTDTAAPRACPPAESVRMAEWQGEGHWQIVLAMEHEPGSSLLDEPLGPREVEEIRDRVAGPLGDQAWIYGVDGAPCAATVVGYDLA